MATMDVFKADGFSAADMTAEVNKEDSLPTLLRSMEGLFEPESVTTPTVQMEELGGALSLVSAQERRGPAQRVARDKRKLYTLDVPHLPTEDLITADEVAGIRAFGSTSELMQVEALVQRTQRKLRRNIELTLENHALGAIKGQVIDADGSTILTDLPTIFGVSLPSTINFDLDNASPASGALRTAITGALRIIDRALKSLATIPTKGYVAVCGDTFFDQLVAHTEVRETVKNWSAAATLREDGRREVIFGGVRWINYVGTDDNSTVAVAATACHIFPVGIPGLFREIWAPANYVETVNTPGLPFYSKRAIDPEFQKWVKVEVQSNPLLICTQPGVLQQGVNT